MLLKSNKIKKNEEKKEEGEVLDDFTSSVTSKIYTVLNHDIKKPTLLDLKHPSNILKPEGISALLNILRRATKENPPFKTFFCNHSNFKILEPFGVSLEDFSIFNDSLSAIIIKKILEDGDYILVKKDYVCLDNLKDVCSYNCNALLKLIEKDKIATGWRISDFKQNTHPMHDLKKEQKDIPIQKLFYICSKNVSKTILKRLLIWILNKRAKDLDEERALLKLMTIIIKNQNLKKIHVISLLSDKLMSIKKKEYVKVVLQTDRLCLREIKTLFNPSCFLVWDSLYEHYKTNPQFGILFSGCVNRYNISDEKKEIIMTYIQEQNDKEMFLFFENKIKT